jgi:hypothetical protein
MPKTILRADNLIVCGHMCLPGEKTIPRRGGKYSRLPCHLIIQTIKKSRGHIMPLGSPVRPINFPPLRFLPSDRLQFLMQT